jgi:hypothetical protein
VNQEFDNSPQAKFVKEVLKKEKPELSETELEQIWLERLHAVQRELGEGTCSACGG